ncbi:ion channel TACAN isoform X2 [Parasteatoda tepidariorum]|uniref:ion channel TACAN isoform X2 n=1 Tax=Parasteatoda tepidariorum TaxID=114398 RepID=UPI00077FD78E|nr:ion channel TACAN isoform X2 [Parasteatoda tepidariorum]
MNIENLLALKKEWDLLTKEYGDLEVHEKQYEKAVEDLGKCQNACSKSLAHQWYRLKQISEEIKKCGATSKEEIDLIESLKQEIELRKVQLDDIQSNLPRSNGLYLRIILGGVNVTIVNKEDSKKYKEEYERFKVTVTIIILILSAQSILFSYRALDAILHFLLVWYYCTLTIRESILVVNGSRIKGWWRVNHFITCIQAGVIIVWPDGVMYDQFRKQFTLYTCYTSILQFLQFNYQQGCLYRLRALGERHKMDITIEGFHSWMWRGLTFLLPFLYFGYIFQLYNAYTLFNLSKDEQCVEWQVFVSAVIFFMLFVGNTLTTSRVLHQKLTEKIINSLNTVGEKETTKKSN